MREKLLEVILQMIEEKEGIGQINLRQVSKRAGCAHTNVYNYFDNTAEMLWQAAIPAIQLIKKQTIDQLATLPIRNDKERLHAVFMVHIEFALAHQGIYRFIWLEKAPDTVAPPEALNTLLGECWDGFIEAIFTTESRLSLRMKNRIGHILFAYLLGEIVLLINKRYIPGREEKVIEQICENGYALYQLLKFNDIKESEKNDE